MFLGEKTKHCREPFLVKGKIWSENWIKWSRKFNLTNQIGVLLGSNQIVEFIMNQSNRRISNEPIKIEYVSLILNYFRVSNRF